MRAARSGGTDALQVFCLAFGEQIVHRVKMYGAGGLGASANIPRFANIVAGIGDAGFTRASGCRSDGFLILFLILVVFLFLSAE